MGFELTAANMATILVDGSVIFLLAGVLIDTSIMRKRGRDDDKLFFLLVIIDMVMALADIPAYLVDGRDIPGGRIITVCSMTVFYIAMVLICMVWLHYCIVRFSSTDGTSPSPWHRLLFIPGLLTELLLIVNIFTGIFFYTDEANVYYHGILFIPLLILMGLYVLGAFILIARYRAGSGKKALIPVWIYMVPLVVGLVVPFALGGISLTSIGCGMSIVFTHLGSASELADSSMEGGERA